MGTEDDGCFAITIVTDNRRILCRHDRTHRRAGRYQPKGVPYPALPATAPNQTHQLDLGGPLLPAEHGSVL